MKVGCVNWCSASANDLPAKVVSGSSSVGRAADWLEAFHRAGSLEWLRPSTKWNMEMMKEPRRN